MLNVYEKVLANLAEPNSDNVPGHGKTIGSGESCKICFVLEDNGKEIGRAEVASCDGYYLQSIDCEDIYFDFFNRSILFIFSSKLSKKIYVSISEYDKTCGDNTIIADKAYSGKFRGKNRVDYYSQFGFCRESDTHLAVLSHEIVFPHECGK